MWFLHHCSTQSHVSVRKIWGCTVALELLSNGVASACDSSASESTSWHHDACFAKPRQSPYSTQWHDQIKKTKQKKTTQLDNFWESQMWEWGSIRVEKRVISIFESLNLGLVHLMSVMSTKWLLLDPMVSWRPILQLYRQIAITCTTTHADKAKHAQQCECHTSEAICQTPTHTQPPPSQA